MYLLFLNRCREWFHCVRSFSFFLFFSFLTADIRFRTRRVWRDIADMDPQECNNKLASYQSRFAYPLLDLQADSCACVQNGGAPLLPPCYLHLDIPKHCFYHGMLWQCTQIMFACMHFLCRNSQARRKWTLWQVLLCCRANWGACSFPLWRLVCMPSHKEVFFLFLPFCHALKVFCRGSIFPSNSWK